MPHASSSNFIRVNSIKDGVAVLKSGQAVAVLMVSSVNFALKSEDEQKAIIHRFQKFLNSLDFSLQIIVQSRDLNIDPYLKDIKEKERKQEDELLRVQTKEYHDFIQALVETTNIMEKNFYVVVPYSTGEARAERGIKSQIMSLFKKESKKEKKERFQELKDQLWQRVEHTASNLKAMGMRAVPLNSQELVELFFNLYNPGEKPKKSLADISELKLG